MSIPPGPRNRADGGRLPQQPQTPTVGRAGRARELRA